MVIFHGYVSLPEGIGCDCENAVLGFGDFWLSCFFAKGSASLFFLPF